MKETPIPELESSANARLYGRDRPEGDGHYRLKNPADACLCASGNDQMVWPLFYGLLLILLIQINTATIKAAVKFV